MLVTSTTDGLHSSPAGQVTHTIVPAGRRTDGAGRVYRLQAFQFDGVVCGVSGMSAAVPVHRNQRQEGTVGADPSPENPVAAGPSVAAKRRLRPVSSATSGGRALAGAAGPVGHPPSRYFGRVKTRFQVYLAATVANLTLVLGKIGLSGSTGGGAAGHRVVLNDVRAVVANAAANFSVVRLGQLWSLILRTSALLPKSLSPTRAFRPGF